MEILDYNVIRNNNFDRTKSYFSCYYNSIVLFTDYDAKSYNFAIRYNDNTRNNELYVILYKDEVINDSIPITRMLILDLNYFLLKKLLIFLM